MALKKIGIKTLIAAIQERVEETGLRCYDYVEENTAAPFYFAEVIRQTPAHSKTMFRDVFTVWIHCIAEGDSSVGVSNLIENLQEVMTEDITLPEPFELVLQTDAGVQTIKTDETGEKHAVVAFEFMICYGFKCK